MGSDPQSRLDAEPEPDAGNSNQEDDEPDGDQEDEKSQNSAELAISSARKPIAEAIEESDDGATTENVVEVVPHTPEKAREHIEAMLEDGIITRDDGRLRTV